MKSFNGCWTCRLRRKKCDERQPVCNTCAALHITCHYGKDKPEWMDGGVRQEEMAERFKREVKEMAHRRREGERMALVSSDLISMGAAATSGLTVLPQQSPRVLTSPGDDHLKATPDIQNHGKEPCPETSTERLQRNCTLSNKNVREIIAFGRSDTILLMFYLEDLLPFLFPFYSPSLLQGGRAWFLEMMMSSPIVRQAALCQSSYFFSLERGTVNDAEAWETVLRETREAFEMLRFALQVIDKDSIMNHLHGAVRIMASMMQVQRFEVATLNFNNCLAHLNGALALFRQLLHSFGADGPGASSQFSNVMSRLGPSSWVLPAQSISVPSAEQAAFRFSSALLIFDDIVASTVLQVKPQLYEYHGGLLLNIDGAGEPLVNLEAVIGCQNWVMVQIGEIAALDAWKHQRKREGNLDIMELVRCATVIKGSLEARLTLLESEHVTTSKESSSVLDVLAGGHCRHSKTPASQTSLVTQVWAHAALVYLFIVVSGWQPASADVRYHVSQIIELLAYQISPPALLRTMVWPFCVAGCLAEPAQEMHLRGMAKALQPPSVFGTVRKALEIMENVWCSRDAEDIATRDLATCFRSQGDLVLLV
ncbi:fungal-specific transcription factor domain-containing protein [Xylariales sp. PMI_506]|nr:fungal-specific transcription factor domain-containing protein [Xylariales sp. PMI_506]